GSPIRGHSGPVMGAAFSSCTRKIASASLDETIRTWDAESGNELKLLKQRIPNVGPISFCQEDSTLICIRAGGLGPHPPTILDLETSSSWPLLPIYPMSGGRSLRRFDFVHFRY
ncbi:hypothetical protein DFH07DRAFT_755817, partial [Mycena maculata]